MSGEGRFLRVEEIRYCCGTGISPLTDLAVQISRSEFLKRDSPLYPGMLDPGRQQRVPV
jgi:hypothetical protein